MRTRCSHCRAVGRVPRKLRLFRAACFRYDWLSWTSRRERAAVVTAEQIADGLAADKDINIVREDLARRLDRWGDLEYMPHVPDVLLRPDFAAKDVRACVGQVLAQAESAPDAFDGCATEKLVELTALPRDIIGNPYQPPSFGPRWRTSDTMGPARGIYEDRTFDRLLLFADALMVSDVMTTKSAATAGRPARVPVAAGWWTWCRPRSDVAVAGPQSACSTSRSVDFRRSRQRTVLRQAAVVKADSRRRHPGVPGRVRRPFAGRPSPGRPRPAGRGPTRAPDTRGRTRGSVGSPRPGPPAPGPVARSACRPRRAGTGSGRPTGRAGSPRRSPQLPGRS